MQLCGAPAGGANFLEAPASHRVQVAGDCRTNTKMRIVRKGRHSLLYRMVYRFLRRSEKGSFVFWEGFVIASRACLPPALAASPIYVLALMAGGGQNRVSVSSAPRRAAAAAELLFFRNLASEYCLKPAASHGTRTFGPRCKVLFRRR